MVDPPINPGDEFVMVITVDPVIVPPSKVTSISPSLVAVSVDDPVPVLDDEKELEKLVESSDADLDKTIKFGSLCQVMIPETFISVSISTADTSSSH